MFRAYFQLQKIADQDKTGRSPWVMQNSPAESETLRPFHLTVTREICHKDKEFVLRPMKLDPEIGPHHDNSYYVRSR